MKEAFECNDGHSYFVADGRRWNIDETPVEQVIWFYQTVQHRARDEPVKRNWTNVIIAFVAILVAAGWPIFCIWWLLRVFLW